MPFNRICEDSQHCVEADARRAPGGKKAQTMNCQILSTRSATGVGFHTVLAVLPVPWYAYYTE